MNTLGQDTMSALNLQVFVHNTNTKVKFATVYFVPDDIPPWRRDRDNPYVARQELHHIRRIYSGIEEANGKDRSDVRERLGCTRARALLDSE
jgi:hypothetical protein